MPILNAKMLTSIKIRHRLKFNVACVWTVAKNVNNNRGYAFFEIQKINETNKFSLFQKTKENGVYLHDTFYNNFNVMTDNRFLIYYIF